MKYGFIVLLSVIPHSYQIYDWKYDVTSVKVRGRYLQLMQQRYEECSNQISRCNDMKFMYEESPHYEMGYVIGEIIERYRKMVELIKWSRAYKLEILFGTLYRMEFVQKLYFEIYHLVQMMHEIPRKYEHMAEYMDLTGEIDYEELLAIQEARAINERHRERERRKRQKVMKKMRQMFAKGRGWANGTQRQRNKAFPIDYGWEIDQDTWRR